jgi:hypothetical protein
MELKESSKALSSNHLFEYVVYLHRLTSKQSGIRSQVRLLKEGTQ